MSENKLRQRQTLPQNDKKTNGSKEKEKDKKNKFAAVHDELQHATSSFTHRLWTRAVIVISVMTIVYFYTSNQTRETKFALVRENLPLRMQKFKCSEQYDEEMKKYPKCVPTKCGRFVADKLVEAKEVEILLDMAESIIGLAGSSGGASILDIHTGALSYGEQYLNFYKMPEAKKLLKPEQLTVYNLVKGKIKLAIAEQFGIEPSNLFLTSPTFFSRLTNVTAKNIHDEYWHEHVDKETYPSFHYTSLLYLTTLNKDFKGGRFIFVDGIDKNRTTSAIEPKKGRVSAFTSGFENRHHVEKVTEGSRFAITISFTCDQAKKIIDPQMATLDA
ncbi:2-oxoglutarate and iron-dependent oxygenase domain-containing protein 3-like [Calliphora vicina]|uniref:2-oxoglutarate and iron-dependent oxygenase domain-containing protein 3-like n=1 Tax=Calliphora vicina TaxID=7373 RepID=UPI00325BB3D6